MNREVKFRGKRKDINAWAYGDLLQNNDGSANIRTNLNTWRENHDDVDAFGDNLSVDIDTVGQFTGLYDKNKKEIYEGDILRFYLNHKERTCSIGWNEDLGAWCVALYQGDKVGQLPLGNWLHDKWMVVVGNIYDNKDLIKTNV